MTQKVTGSNPVYHPKFDLNGIGSGRDGAGAGSKPVGTLAIDASVGVKDFLFEINKPYAIQSIPRYKTESAQISQ